MLPDPGAVDLLGFLGMVKIGNADWSVSGKRQALCTLLK